MHDYDSRNRPKTLASIPPPSNGYWGWVRDELKEKANKEWIVSELKSLKRSFDDTKTTVTDVRKATEKPYECTQMKEIEKLKDWQYKIMNWKIPVIVSIVVLVLGAAGQYFSLKDSVEDGNESRQEVQQVLKKIQTQQNETSKVIVEMKEQALIREVERKEELRDFAKQVTTEIKADIVKTSKKRNRDR